MTKTKCKKQEGREKETKRHTIVIVAKPSYKLGYKLVIY